MSSESGGRGATRLGMREESRGQITKHPYTREFYRVALSNIHYFSIHICICICICMCVYMYIYIYMCVCVCLFSFFVRGDGS